MVYGNGDTFYCRYTPHANHLAKCRKYTQGMEKKNPRNICKKIHKVPSGWRYTGHSVQECQTFKKSYLKNKVWATKFKMVNSLFFLKQYTFDNFYGDHMIF